MALGRAPSPGEEGAPAAAGLSPSSERAGSQGSNERENSWPPGPAFLPNVTHRPKWVLKSLLDLSREKAQGEGTGGGAGGRPRSACLCI